jgi:hypothetical protein
VQRGDPNSDVDLVPNVSENPNLESHNTPISGGGLPGVHQQCAGLRPGVQPLQPGRAGRGGDGAPAHHEAGVPQDPAHARERHGLVPGQGQGQPPRGALLLACGGEVPVQGA